MEGNFGRVIPLLEKNFRVLCVSYDGFDETENTEFPTMPEETEKIEAYIKEHCSGHIHGAYGCSLGGSVVSLLVGRKNIHIDHAIIGSSDMDQAPKWLAKMKTAMVMPLFYPFLTGKENSRMEKMFNKKMNQGDEKEADYMKKFMEVMGRDSGIDFSFISKDSVRNQFCTDLYTKVGEHISAPGTVIHVFYARKMGEKYLARYQKYFADPDIREFDLRHEELLLDADVWTNEVCKACGITE